MPRDQLNSWIGGGGEPDLDLVAKVHAVLDFRGSAKLPVRGLPPHDRARTGQCGGHVVLVELLPDTGAMVVCDLGEDLGELRLVTAVLVDHPLLRERAA